MSTLADALAKAAAYQWAEHGPAHVHNWYVSANLATDHIYPSCPALLRGYRGNLPAPVTHSVLYPEAGENGDICGWCTRVWRARRKTVAE